MKKTILALVIVAMVSTPCFAQEIEPEGLFSVDGTLWSICVIELISYPPSVSMNCDEEIGFTQGKVYNSTTRTQGGTASYIDLGVVSIAYNIYGDREDWFIAFAIMQPSIGLGLFSRIQYYAGGCGRGMCPPSFAVDIGIMFKIDDNWTPPGIE